MRSRKNLLVRFFLLCTLVSLAAGVLSCGPEKPQEAVPKTNGPPVITSVKILPENPNHESDLSVMVQCQDPDGDPITYEYDWMVNGRVVPGGARGSLKSGSFKKGDSIQVKVTPNDGKTRGEPFLSPEVRVQNSPPVIEKVWIEPTVVHVQDRLRARVESSDKDKDFVYYTYQWEKNGVVLSEEKSETLEPGHFKKGDALSVTVIPDDRETQGKPKRSDPVIVSNSPPVITSSPPTSLQGFVYLYQVKAEDPDLDLVSYGLKSGPKGMVIDQSTGLLRWEIQKENEGSHVVEVEAFDSDGGKSLQRYTLVVKLH